MKKTEAGDWILDEKDDAKARAAGGVSRPGPGIGTAPPIVSKRTDYQVAQEVVSLWPRPLAAQAGEFWEFDLARGWQICTTPLLNRLNQERKRKADGCRDIAYTRLLLPEPTDNGRPTHYWERVGGVWDGRWIPFPIHLHQVVYTDQVINLLDQNQDLDISERLVFGPMITRSWTTEDGKDPRCEEFEEMITFALPNPQTRKYFQQIMGLILQPHTHFRGQIILWGVRYAMKTSLATAICCAPAGACGYSVSQEAEIIRDKWATLSLVNKFANISDDSPRVEGDRYLGWFKRYTSGSFVVEPKFHKTSKAVTTAKLISTCNDPQSWVDPSGATAMRLYPFQFTRSVERTGLISQDQKMTAAYWSEPERRAGVLEWLLTGLRSIWVENGGRLSEPDTIKTTRTEICLEGDPILAELKERLVSDPAGWVTTGDLLKVLPPMGRNQRALETTVGQYIRLLFPGVKQTRRQEKSSRARGYAGIRLIE